MPRILFVIPYFGRWPFWMPFFLESCRFNPTIDWLFFTDCGVPANCPDNVRFVEESFASYCARVSERLGIDFSPTNPYKLCDLKPALGYVHADSLDGYDFWGISDIDLVYGDLRGYFSAKRLARFDLLSTHARRVSGHLCLLRNAKPMREVFMRVSDWRGCLADPVHHAFDEKAFSKVFIRHKNWPEPLRRAFDACRSLRRRSEFTEAYSTPNTRIAWHDGGYAFPRRWFWNEGRLLNDLDGEREFPYFHFLVWKHAWRDTDHGDVTRYQTLSAGGVWVMSERGFSA